MTISKGNSSAPLVVVVGATGVQGGSVVRNLAESDRAYRLLGLTRQAPDSAAALTLRALGVEVVQVDIRVGNEERVREAFAGAEVVFAVTNFWEHMDPAREEAEGKLMADAAAAAGARLLVWSGLEDISKATRGKYTHVYHFDGKAAVTAYARKLLRTVDVQAGFYMTNFSNPLIAPRPIDGDGSGNVLLWDHPNTAGAQPQPYIDMARDYGLFVRYAIETPWDAFPRAANSDARTIYTYGERITHAHAAAIFERVRNKTILIRPLTIDVYLARLAAQGLPPLVVEEMRDIGYVDEFGYYCGKETGPEQEEIRKGLARPLRGFEEFLRAHPEFAA